ncbi:hypothetical protein [Paenibacillus sp.]|uniref:hypothetical protein n=1 Tax=Paenibacillus sp. TaxID=58172 RepID=UPI00281C92B8|nr:hypothetical protein [Paenibacillus sp.]MDR0270340.1 hypothetical protein [Paenibacillus sp.]
MDCPVCDGNGELECIGPLVENQEYYDCPLCESRKIIPCNRCSGNGYLEQEA